MANDFQNNPLRLQLERTPSPDDPKEARDFYYLLGIFTVAWGRLENHFLYNIITIFNLQPVPRIFKRVPMPWESRAEFWEKAFSSFPILRPERETALEFLAEIKDLAKDRHFISHALWGQFSPVPPLSIKATILRNKKGGGVEMDHGRTSVSLDQLITVSAKADHLNLALYPLSSFLMNLRGGSRREDFAYQKR